MFGRKNREEVELLALLDTLIGDLPDANIADARELIDHGEYGEALDLICTQIFEYEIVISTDIYKRIEESGRRMDMAESSWDFLVKK